MKSCRACRLDKCLLEGMDPTMVEAEQSPAQRQFIQSLSKRREFLQQQLQKKNEKETIPIIGRRISNGQRIAINGLSDAGRLALQHLSEHYTNALMNHLRTNHGNMAATLRYAEFARQAESLLFSARRQPTEFYQRRN
ncbi:hypothetical protein niasHT_029738 [Heterodera trifolii]|uniref:Nuclear receptor domain-containing protein n=1 Tax=Heterodera trifolii TaxID=157864 RepID=A0ABD2KSF2_9BILA